MSDVEVKPATQDVYNTVRKLSSPNNKYNWDTRSFAMQMMFREKNLEHVIKGGFREGFNAMSNVLPDTSIKADNRLVSLIIASRLHKENFVTIVRCQYSLKGMWRALYAAQW